MPAARLSTGVRNLWETRGEAITRLGVIAMALGASVFLGYELWRLLIDTSEMGAIDLGLRHRTVQAFFADEPVYRQFGSAVYPPATLVLLWPFLGWLDLFAARWLWGATTLAILAWLVAMLLRELKPEPGWARAFVVLLPLAMYATGATVGNGQLTVHVLTPMLAACLLLARRAPSARRDVLAAGLFVLALAKPTIAAPFFWLVVFLPGSLRPALLCAGIYGALTLLAAAFQSEGVLAILGDWLAAARVGLEHGVTKDRGYGWIGGLGILGAAGNETAAISLALLAGLGLWTWRRRDRDAWLLLGVAALVARFWTYHRWYDDLLLLLPIVGVLRIATRELGSGWGTAAAGLLAWNLPLLLLPGGRFVFRSGGFQRLGLVALEDAYLGALVLGWIGLLVFLLAAAERSSTPRGNKSLSGELPA